MAAGLTYLIYSKIVGIFGTDISRIVSVSVVPAEQLVTKVLVIFLCLGISIGVCGSMISIRRFLDK
jgi:cell division transport system permease protein